MRPALGLLALSVSLLVLPALAHADTKAPPAPPAPRPQPQQQQQPPQPKPPQPPPPQPPKPDPAAISARAAVLAPIQIDSLTLTPIVATASGGKEPEMLVLDEAMGKQLVKISETAEESVNDLTFVNSADRPVFVLAGEVIIGGKQDRIIGANTVIPPKTTLAVPVYCVEHGRWDEGKGPKTFTTANALAHGRLRGKASFEAQGDVWKEVAETNAKRGTVNATDTYRTVAKQQSDGTLKTWQQKIDEALGKLPAADRARMIGYAIALNGQVATVDMFQSPGLFKKLEPKLLRSYMTEAVDVTAQRDVKPPAPAAVRSFMDDADKAAERDAYETKAAKTRVRKGNKSARSTVDFDDDIIQGAAKPAPVYQSYQHL